MREIPEREWKILRSLKEEKLNLFCTSILKKIKALIEDGDKDTHKTYLDMWRLLNREDDRVVLMFDDLKRSTAFLKLAAWRKNGLLSDEDFDRLSEETRESINALVGYEIKT